MAGALLSDPAQLLLPNELQIVEDNCKQLKNFLSTILTRRIKLSSKQNKSKNSK